jgi:hypothetical protein
MGPANKRNSVKIATPLKVVFDVERFIIEYYNLSKTTKNTADGTFIGRIEFLFGN